MIDLVILGIFAFWMGRNFDGFDLDFSQNQDSTPSDTGNGLPTYAGGRPQWQVLENGLVATNDDTGVVYSAHKVQRISYKDDEIIESNTVRGVVFADGKYKKGLFFQPARISLGVGQPAEFSMMIVDNQVRKLALTQAQKDEQERLRLEEQARIAEEKRLLEEANKEKEVEEKRKEEPTYPLTYEDYTSSKGGVF
tara:strand:- start:1865 stop:2449 length:585 start_codon:yes stop_codon:yes gene_type:complete